MTQTSYTPEALALRKSRLREQIVKKQAALSRTAEALLTPDTASTRAEQFATAFSRAIALADGALMGYRLMKRFGFLVPKRKKRRR